MFWPILPTDSFVRIGRSAASTFSVSSVGSGAGARVGMYQASFGFQQTERPTISASIGEALVVSRSIENRFCARRAARRRSNSSSVSTR